VFLGRLVLSQPRIRLMLSSQMHIPVSDYFLDALLTVQTSPLETYDDMRYYIETEISRLQKGPLGNQSILYKDPALRERLEKALQEHANGMFRWVSIWISIFYPPERFHPLRTRKEAEAMLGVIETQTLTSEHSEETVHKEKLKLLDDAYGRLYDMTGHTKSEKEYKVRAYRVVLCCYEPLTLSALAEAVLIEPDGTVNTDIDDSYVRDLCHNFLIEGLHNLLGFAHESARLFLEAMRVRGEHRDVVLDDFSDRLNHLEMARICLRVMGDSEHQIWANNDMRPAYWAEMLCDWTLFQDAKMALSQQPDQIETGKLLGWHGQVALFRQPHFAVYVSLYILKHCYQAQLLSSTTAKLHSEVISVLTKKCSAFRGWALYTILLYHAFSSISEPRFGSLRYAGHLNDLTRCSVRCDVNLLEPSPLLILSGWNLFDCLYVSQYISDVTMGPPSDISPSSVQIDSIFKGLSARNYKGETAIHLAALNNQTSAVKTLLEIERALAKGNGDSWKSRLLVMRDSAGCTPLHSALIWMSDVEDPHIPEIVSILVKSGAALVIAQDDQQGDIHQRPFCDSKDRFGDTPLAVASQWGFKNAAKLLLETGQVDINDSNLEGATPLMKASVHGHTRIVRLLLEQDGVHIDAVDKKGWSALFYACSGRKKNVVKLLLQTRRFNMNSVDVRGDTILLQTIKSPGRTMSIASPRVIKLLFAQEGLDPDAKDRAGRTPLWWAYLTRSKNIVKLLLKTGKVNIHPQDDKGERPPDIERSCGSCTGYLPDWVTSYHCGICTSGGSDFVLCKQCVDRGERCLDVEHSLDRQRTRYAFQL
jgi:ankyrin repeat protein